MNEFFKIFDGDLELEDLYNSLDKFRADFELILGGSMTFNDLQRCFDKNLRNIKYDMRIFCKMAYLMNKEIDKHLSQH